MNQSSESKSENSQAKKKFWYNKKAMAVYALIGIGITLLVLLLGGGLLQNTEQILKLNL